MMGDSHMKTFKLELKDEDIAFAREYLDKYMGTHMIGGGLLECTSLINGETEFTVDQLMSLNNAAYRCNGTVALEQIRLILHDTKTTVDLSVHEMHELFQWFKLAATRLSLSDSRIALAQKVAQGVITEREMIFYDTKRTK